eukprot:CAMPEP_0181307526 /NCGR_PEP_ID=MMETSP1101-20121128/10933_1 /TAXON_ID=46948 /ORGANISM="Rhodomonas abbreviata, Strain Caron Lab Isolate" /LENGTH=138 /DNA_ID=CAMNT_0023413761 /DNA_START=242 /DNA_END=658 /DNA_ORIENTATION=+
MALRRSHVTTCQRMVVSPPDPSAPLKRLWIGLERMMVTITQGTEMAEAAAVLEEERLFGSRRLARARNAVRDATDTLMRNFKSSDDSFSGAPGELSGGFNEGAGDDLPLIKNMDLKREKSKYDESSLRKDYGQDAFKD